MTKTGQQLRLSINRALINKNETGDVGLYANGWENARPTISELAEHVRNGHAFTVELKGRRRADHFVAGDVVAVDIDCGMIIEQALAHPLVAGHAGIIYTTPSHTADAPRYRIIFCLASTITDPTEMRAIQRSLALRLGGDFSATDPARIFFGNTNAQTWLFPDRVLTLELQRDLIAQGVNPPVSDVAGNATHLAGGRSGLRLRLDHQIKLASGRVLPFSVVAPKTPVFCPFHADERASGFVVISKKGVTGLYCSTCAVTYWSADVGAFVFDDFDPIVRAARRHFEQHRDHGPLAELFGMPRAELEMLGSTGEIVRGQPAPEALQPGLTLIKSGKGTGKTQSLRRLLTPMRSVLLVGNRRSLIDQICRRLDLRCYLDAPPKKYLNIVGKRTGICLDSLLRIEPVKAPPEALILDESEQVLAHFLADTLERQQGGGRQRIFRLFASLVASAKYVVALDADLGFVTYRTLARMRCGGAVIRRR